MFETDQLVKIVCNTLAQVLVVIYLNFKDERRSFKTYILLFSSLLVVIFVVYNFIISPLVLFPVSLLLTTLCISIIYGLHVLESFSLSLISFFILILSDFTIQMFMMKILGIEFKNIENTQNTIIANSIFMLLTIVIIRIRQQFRKEKYEPKNNIKIFFFICVLFIVVITTLNISFYKDTVNNDPLSVLMFNLIAFLIYFIICLFLIIVYVSSSNQKNLLEQQKKEYEQLIEYTGIIEGLYENIRTQKHDFMNVLFSIKGYMDSNRIDELKDYYYNSVLKEYGGECPPNQYLSSLNLINNPGLKGILSYKLNQAVLLNIMVQVNIFSAIVISGIDTIDLCKLVGILIDNAIEASAESPHPEIHIYMESDELTTTIIIANTYLQEPNVDMIFKRGFSTKGKNRGLGLYIAKCILSHYPSVLLKTTVENALFFQEIVIPK